jgi:predicted aspartyl protease
MGLTYVDAVATGPQGQSRPLRLLVDSGASYTLLPPEDWQALELRPARVATFTLADGSTRERGISECHLRLLDHQGHTPVVLGEPGDEPQLGIVTLEAFGLVLDPFQRTLHAAQLRL